LRKYRVYSTFCANFRLTFCFCLSHWYDN